MRPAALLLGAVLVLSACGASAAPERPAPVVGVAIAEPEATAEPRPTTEPRTTARPVSTAEPASTAMPRPTATPRPTAEPAAPVRPAWLGTRPLGEAGAGSVPPQPTPPELDDRRLPPPASDLPPPGDDAYAATIAPVPEDVLARSTWGPHCPVAVDDLRYLTITHWGFDGGHHSGELLVHARAADDLAAVFGALHAARFPLEEVRVIRAEELDLAPTGDGNVTTAFVCRAARGSGVWSQHAHGLAVDLNPFHNPYLKGTGATAAEALVSGATVLPELATAYLERDRHRPGMVQPGDAATAAFAAIGWGWGGDWASLRDWMHFSANGR